MSNIVQMNTKPDEVVVRLDADKIAELRRKKLIRDQEESIELDPIDFGEIQIGILTPEERTLFMNSSMLLNEINSIERECTARLLEMTADSVRKSERLDQVKDNLDQSKMFPSKEEAEDYFRRWTNLEYIKAEFNMSLRERFGHVGVYGVRKDFVVVRVGYKFKLPED